MIMDASSKIAVKCSECGEFSLIELNIFNMKISTSIGCRCGHKMFKIHVSKKQLILEIDCIACEKKHVYRFKLTDIMERKTNIISCPETGIEIAFLGKDDYVNDIVDRYNNEMQEIFKSFGFVEKHAKRNIK